MGKKTASKATKVVLSPKIKALIAGAAIVGYDVMGGFQAGVALAKAIGPRKQALADAGVQYQAGYVARYLEEETTFKRRWGNMDTARRIEESLAILAKATPDSTKADRRTDLEHKACRAASTSWSACKTKAGVITPTKRTPRASTANVGTGNVPPVDLVKASPKFKSKAEANDYFATAAAALLTTCDVNSALKLKPQLTSAVSDFKAAIAKALGL